MIEEWRAVVGWEGFYEVSNLGRVRSLPRYRKARPGVRECIRPGKVLKQTPRANTRYTYYSVCLADKYRNIKVTENIHTLVAKAFIGPPPSPQHHCAHWDNNSFNNCVTNLRWATVTENMRDKERHGTKLLGEKLNWSKLTDKEALDIKLKFRDGWTVDQVANYYDLTLCALRNIKNGKTWKHIKLDPADAEGEPHQRDPFTPCRE